MDFGCSRVFLHLQSIQKHRSYVYSTPLAQVFFSYDLETSQGCPSERLSPSYNNLFTYYNFIFQMNTPKYSGNYSRNNLSSSPLRNNPKGRYFSSDEVTKMIKTSFEPKIQYLMQQLEQRQQIIAQLNNKLNQNDQRLKHQSSLIQSHIKKQRDTTNMQSYIVGTINQLINDKTKQAWETISTQLKQIVVKTKAEVDPKKMEAMVQVQLEKMKQTVMEFIDLHKKKSNNYWQKIKQALNKINGKIVSTEKDLMDINVKIQNFQDQRNKDRQTIFELQNSKNVVKNMIQLKKSVDNIYENYQSILNLQKNLRQRLEDQHGESLWHQPDFFKSNSKILPGTEEMIALQYSKEDIGGQKAVFEEWKPYENTTQPILSPMRISQQQDKSSSELYQLQKTTPIKSGNEHSELFSLNNSNQMISKIHNSTFLLNHSLQTRKEMCNEVRQRLLEIIQIKNLRKPLEVRLDEQINCLKTAEGNYLFDAKGNMFKLKIQDLLKLQQQGILTRNRLRKTSLSNSKIKKTKC